MNFTEIKDILVKTSNSFEKAKNQQKILFELLENKGFKLDDERIKGINSDNLEELICEYTDHSDITLNEVIRLLKEHVKDERKTLRKIKCRYMKDIGTVDLWCELTSTPCELNSCLDCHFKEKR